MTSEVYYRLLSFPQVKLTLVIQEWDRVIFEDQKLSRETYRHVTKVGGLVLLIYIAIVS